MSKPRFESFLSIATGALMLYAAVTVLRHLGAAPQPLAERPPAVQTAANGHCGACLARRE